MDGILIGNGTQKQLHRKKIGYAIVNYTLQTPLLPGGLAKLLGRLFLGSWEISK